MLVMSIVSLKGGVGKTTLVLGLAGAVLERGLRVLVVDLDPQANATTALDPKDVKFTTNDVLADARAGVLKEAVTTSGWGEEVEVIAAEPALEHRNRTEGKGSELRLRKAMNGTPASYDLVLVDTPPSLGELTKNALAASHRALVVAEPTLFALQGAQQALDAVDIVRRSFNLRLHTIGIVANRVRHTAEHRFRLNELTNAYGDLVFDPAMLDRSAVMQAQGACIPVQRWHSSGARAASQVLSTYLDRVLSTTVKDRPSLLGRR
jgi:chromosome partitioning protein